MNKITALVVEADKEPYVKDIEDSLASLQQAVGGRIEAIYPYEDEIAIICHESGKLEGLNLNRAIFGQDKRLIDIIAGTFLVVGLGEENFASLSASYLKKYYEKFKACEEFIKLNKEIIVLQKVAE